MAIKMVVAKPGFNALTETNPDNLIFSSDYNTLKYYTSGTSALTINGTGTANTQTVLGTVAHNLGYTPFFIVYANDLDHLTRYNIVPYDNSVFSTIKRGNAYADSTNIYFQFQANPGSGTALTLTFAYKIFKNNTGL